MTDDDADRFVAGLKAVASAIKLHYVPEKRREIGMTREEKEKFIIDLIDTVKDKILANVDKMPAGWDGVELRYYIAEHFADVAWDSMSSPSRKRKYNNDVLVMEVSMENYGYAIDCSLVDEVKRMAVDSRYRPRAILYELTGKGHKIYDILQAMQCLPPRTYPSIIETIIAETNCGQPVPLNVAYLFDKDGALDEYDQDRDIVYHSGGFWINLGGIDGESEFWVPLDEKYAEEEE